ncbi:MAG: hypothetical protein U5K69_10445 [Balneolaceae bacterium]|nr:hypothetical protein [Balneolaceae bacterium]
MREYLFPIHHLHTVSLDVIVGMIERTGRIDAILDKNSMRISIFYLFTNQVSLLHLHAGHLRNRPRSDFIIKADAVAAYFFLFAG